MTLVFRQMKHFKFEQLMGENNRDTMIKYIFGEIVFVVPGALMNGELLLALEMQRHVDVCVGTRLDCLLNK